MNPLFEDEVAQGLNSDDVEILAKKIENHTLYIKSLIKHSKKSVYHSKTQWSRIHDSVQEHFSSHVTINGSSHRLPHNIYALKQIAKQSWMLYKKRECERRKRLRLKLEKEKEIEEKGGPANLLLSMVDACEICRKLFITVNLFWGYTLCDLCYFNEDILKDIMSKRKNLVQPEHEKLSNCQLVKYSLSTPSSSNSIYFNITSSSTEKTPPSIFKSIPTPVSSESELSSSYIDFREPSVYDHLADIISDSDNEPCIHEEDEFGKEVLDLNNDSSDRYYFSQCSLPEDIINESP